MKKIRIMLPEIKIIGIGTRTNNASELNPSIARIGALFHQYSNEKIADKIPNRLHPGITYCVYTDYHSDEHGDYTYVVGEAVSSFEEVPEGFKGVIIPAQNYICCTSEQGRMPDVCISLWQDIWAMTPQALGGTRSYKTDFEFYDHRAVDPHKTVLDVVIGVEE